MEKLEIINCENTAKVTFESSIFINCYRSHIMLEAMKHNAVTASSFKIIFSTEKEMYAFIGMLSQLSY